MCMIKYKERKIFTAKNRKSIFLGFFIALFALVIVSIRTPGFKAASADCASNDWNKSLNIECTIDSEGATGSISDNVEDQLAHEILTDRSELEEVEGWNFNLLWGGYIGGPVSITRSDIGTSYTYLVARDKKSTMVGQTLVRGENSLIFPDKTSVISYNETSKYRTCEKWGFLWLYCKRYSDWTEKDVYKGTYAVGTVEENKLVYDNLRGVRMVMPSFEINLSNSSSSTVNGVTVYKMKGRDKKRLETLFSNNRVHEDNGTLQYARGCLVDYCTIINYDTRSQVLLPTLVMVYTATVQFYYTTEKPTEISSGVADVRVATIPVKIYVTYKSKSGVAGRTMQSLNGYMDKSPSSNISYIPVAYDLSPIIDPTYWNMSEASDTSDSPITITARKFNKAVNAGYVEKDGKYILTSFTGIANDGLIDIRAIGIDTERTESSITLDVSGQIYYKSPSVEDLKVTYTIGEGEEQKVNIAEYMVSDSIADAAVKAIRANQDISVKFEFKSGTMVVESKTLSPDYKSSEYPENHERNSVAYRVSDGQKTLSNGAYVYSSMSYSGEASNPSLIAPGTGKNAIKVYKVATTEEGYTTYYYIPFIVDMEKPTTPTLTRPDGHTFTSDTIVVKEIDEVDSYTCNSFDGLDGPVGSSCVIGGKDTAHTTGVITVTAYDGVGNPSNVKTYNIIIDNYSPDRIEANVDVSGSMTSLDEGLSFYELQQAWYNYVPGAVEGGAEGEYTTDLDGLQETFPDLETQYASQLSSVEAYDVVLEDESDYMALQVKVFDYYDETLASGGSAGMKGMFYKHWITGKEEASTWNFQEGDTLTFNQLEGGTNYFAVVSQDNMDLLYKQTVLSDEEKENLEVEEVPTGALTFLSKINIKIYKIKVYGTPYMAKVIATEDGFGLVVRDDIDTYGGAGVSTTIERLLLIDKAASDDTKGSSKTTEQVSGAFNTPNQTPYRSTNLSVEFNQRVKINNAKTIKSNLNDEEYLNKIGVNNLVPYSAIDISNNIQTLVNAHAGLIDFAGNDTFANQMLINGLLLNEQAYIYAEIKVNDNGDIKTLYQKVQFANIRTGDMDNSILEFMNLENGDILDSSTAVISMNGNDEVSKYVGSNMVLKYEYNLFRHRGDDYDSSNAYADGQYNVHYKICYETEGSIGMAFVCGDTKLYSREEGVVLGEVNGDVLYHVYTGIVTGLEYDYSSKRLVLKYNNDEDDSIYNIFSYNENIAYENSVIDGFYEIDFGKFLLDTAVPQITVEYTTIAEYQEGQINKLKDVNYASEYGEGYKNYIIKVTLFNESDKYRHPDDWLRLDASNFTWFAYYSSTGKSVCGSEDRATCDKSLPGELFGVIASKSQPTDTYAPLVYYVQFPLSETLTRQDPSYSVDVVDLMINIKGNNGSVNDGMTLVVDDVKRKENVDFLTIYYDQDGPAITITSSPDKFKDYYSISIFATDVSSNVAKVSFYYGIYEDESSVDGSNVFLLYSQDVNAKTFQGYSAQLTQKGWYTVVAEDEIGLQTVYHFEVVQLNGGVMYSPTLDDTDQAQDDDEDAIIVAAALMSSIVPMLIIIFVIILAIIGFMIWWKLRKVRKVAAMAGKITNSETGKKIINRMPPSKYKKGAQIVQKATSRMPEVQAQNQQQEEVPQEEPTLTETPPPSDGGGEDE